MLVATAVTASTVGGVIGESLRHLWRLTGGSLGMALCVALSWSAVLTVRDKLVELSGGEDVLVFGVAGVIFTCLLLAGIGALARWVTKSLRGVLGAWLCLAAWGHPGDAPAAPRLVAHALFAAGGIALGVVLYREGAAQREQAWVIEGLMMIGGGLVFGLIGGFPWAVGLARAGELDLTLANAAEEHGGKLLTALTISVGAAIGLMEVVS